MTLPNPYAPLLANLAIPIAGIPSPAAIAQGLDYLITNPSGTGAFRLASPDDWTRDSQMVLQANPDYWGGAPKVEQFIVRVIPESSTRLQSVEAGEIDIAWALLPEDVERTRENPDLVIVEDAGLNTNMIELNVGKDPFSSKEVRQALNYAVNKEELSDGLYNGNMVAAGGVLPPVDWAFNPDLQSLPIRPRPGARAAGRGGLRREQPSDVHLHGLHHPAWLQPGGDRLATAIQEYWSEVGVQAEIQTAEWTQYRADRRADMFQCSLCGWQGDNGDPDNFLYTLLEGGQGRRQHLFYDNPEVDDLLGAGASGLRPGAAQAALPPGRATHRRRCALGLPGLPEAPGRHADQHHRLPAPADVHLLLGRGGEGVDGVPSVGSRHLPVRGRRPLTDALLLATRRASP